MNNLVRVGTRPRIFYGWWLALAGLTLLIYSNYARGFITSGLSALALESSDSVTLLGTVAMTSALLSLTISFYLLAIGPFIDKYGPKKVMLVSIPIASVGFITLGFANNTVTFLALQGTLVTWGWAAAFGLTVHTAVANWFRKRRTIALAIVFAATIVPGLLYLIQERNITIEQFSRLNTFIGLGSIMLIIGIPMALLFRHKPEQHGYLPDGQETSMKPIIITVTSEQSDISEANLSLRQAIRSRVFWLLAAALALESLVVSTSSPVRAEYQVNLWRSDLSLLDETRIWFGVFSLAGIFIFGFLGDKFSKRYLLAAAVFIRCISSVILLSGGIVQLYVHGLLFYMGAGIPVLTYAMIADYFGRKSFATIVAFAGIIRMVIMIPIVGGLWFPINWLLSISDNNNPLIAVTVVGGIVSAILFILAKPPQVTTTEEIS